MGESAADPFIEIIGNISLYEACLDLHRHQATPPEEDAHQVSSFNKRLAF